MNVRFRAFSVSHAKNMAIQQKITIIIQIEREKNRCVCVCVCVWGGVSYSLKTDLHIINSTKYVYNYY